MSEPYRLGLISGGIGSWAACKLTVQRHGLERFGLLFTDVLMEDEDTYRFLVESVANVLGIHEERWSHLRPILQSIPPIDEPEARKPILRRLREEAVLALPGLHWIADGRDPWEVFLKERMLGNSRYDPCSKILKRSMSERFCADGFSPESLIRVVGIHWSEEERFQKIRERLAPWKVEAPLCESSLLGYQQLHLWAAREGLRKQRLYEDGFAHGNCGGACVKQGQAGWKMLLERRPKTYAYAERKEQEMREYLGKDVSILTDRRGDGKKKPLTLVQFRERVEKGGQCDLFDFGGCNCFGGVE